TASDLAIFAAQLAMSSFRAKCAGPMLFVFASFADTPAHAVEESLLDCPCTGVPIVAGIANSNTRFGESASVTLSTSAALALNAADGLAASARTAIPFAITRAFAGSPAANVGDRS